MFKINEDKSIYATRGDAVAFSVKANKGSSIYTFPKGSIVRFKVVEKKDCESVVLQKDFDVTSPTTVVGIYLSENDTRFGDVISKPTDYWYEVELNPHTNPQTILGYDDIDGAKIFKLFPEGKDMEFNPTPQELGTVDAELDTTSERPIQNQAVARAVNELREGVALANSTHFEIKATIQNLVDLELNAVKSEYIQRTNDEFESIKEECVQDTHNELQAIKDEYVHDVDAVLEEATTKAVTYATQNAKESENNAKEYMDSAKDYMDTSKACMNTANAYMVDAKEYSNSAKGYMDTSKGYMDDSKAYSDLSKQYMEDALKTTPEGYNELVSKVGLMDIARSNDYTYPKTKTGGLRLLELVGATVQNGEPNPSYPQAIENVGDCVEMVQGIYSTTSGAYMSDNSCVCTKNAIPCKVGDKLKISLDTKSHYRVVFYNDNSFVSASISSEMSTIYETTVPSGANRFTFYLSQSGVTLTPQTVGKISLTVNGKHVVQIVEHGKNLFEDVKAQVLHGKYNAETKEFTCNISSYTFAGFRTTELNDFIMSHLGENITYSVKRPNGNSRRIQIVIYGTRSNGAEYQTVEDFADNVTMTIAEDFTSVSHIDLRVNQGTTITDTTSVFSNFQLELSSVATPYEPYTEKVATILLDEPLKATPDGTKDVLFRENGLCKIARYVKEKPLSEVPGLTAWVNNAGTISVVSSSLTEDRVCSRDELMCNCNILKCFTNSKEVQDNFKIGLAFNPNTTYKNYMYICLPRDIIETVTLTALNEWFDSVGAVVQFALNTPKIEVLDTESQIALNDLETFKDMTYLEVDSKIKPSGIEVEYGTSQVGAYTLKCMNDNDTDKIERAEMKARLDELAVALVSQ